MSLIQKILEEIKEKEILVQLNVSHYGILIGVIKDFDENYLLFEEGEKMIVFNRNYIVAIIPIEK